MRQTVPADATRRASAILKAAGITRRRIKKLDAIAEARERRQSNNAERAYSARPFVLCGIPVRRPAKHILEYSRQNGRFRLRVIGRPDYGLPFGQDRLLLMWIATMAVWQKSREIHFRSAATTMCALRQQGHDTSNCPSLQTTALADHVSLRLVKARLSRELSRGMAASQARGRRTEPESWRQVEYLYHSVLEQEKQRRSAFLKQAWEGDEELRLEVESLLSQAEKTGSCLEDPALELAFNGCASPKVRSDRLLAKNRRWVRGEVNI